MVTPIWLLSLIDPQKENIISLAFSKTAFHLKILTSACYFATFKKTKKCKYKNTQTKTMLPPLADYGTRAKGHA